MNKFSVDIPFDTKPPRLKDLVNRYIMGDVWIRDTPFGPVTDSITLAQKFQLKHSNILRSINKCRVELESNAHYKLEDNLIESTYLAGPEGKERESEMQILQNLALLCFFCT